MREARICWDRLAPVPACRGHSCDYVVEGLGHPAAGCGKQFPRAASWPGTCISVRRTRVAGFLPNLDRRVTQDCDGHFSGAGPKPRAWVVPTLNFKLVFTFGPSAAVPCGSPPGMEDDLLRVKLEKLLVEAEDCEPIGKLATDVCKSANSSKNWQLTFAPWRAILKPRSRAARLTGCPAAGACNQR
jgi:hypothetical protein